MLGTLLSIPPTGQSPLSLADCNQRSLGEGLRNLGLVRKGKTSSLVQKAKRRKRQALKGIRSFRLSHPDPIVHYLAFIPVVDGDFIPDDPINLYNNTADIDYLAGINNMDGHLFATVDVPAIDKTNQDVTE